MKPTQGYTEARMKDQTPSLPPVRSEPLLERLAHWIVQHPPRYGGNLACAQCYPHSDMLKEGFVCAYHEALRIVDSSNNAVTGSEARP